MTPTRTPGFVMPKRAQFAASIIAGITPVLLIVPSNAAHPADVAPSGTPCADQGLGDRIHPSLGTAHLYVRRYRTHLTFAPALRSYVAKTTLHAVTTASISCAGLDFAGGMVTSATADGVPVAAVQSGERIILSLPSVIPAGKRLRVTVATRTAVPRASDLDPTDFPPGIFRAGGVFQVLGQPSRAHWLVPMADSPRQKAPWRIIVDTPNGLSSAVSGHLVKRHRRSGLLRSVFVTNPIATHVLQIAAGRLQLKEMGHSHGVRLRDWVTRNDAAATRDARSSTSGHLDFLTSRLGPFPFKEYGVLATPVGGELENQTLSVLSIDELRRPVEVDGVMVHELVHLWFGNSVSVRSWDDLWLSEGHAVYYTMAYENRRGPKHLRRAFDGLCDDVIAAVRAYGPIARPRPGSFDSRASAPYGPTAYIGGALVLHQLEQDVGVDQFARIERKFLKRFAGGSASTDNYLDVVADVAGPRPARRLRAALFATRVICAPTAR